MSSLAAKYNDAMKSLNHAFDATSDSGNLCRDDKLCEAHLWAASALACAANAHETLSAICHELDHATGANGRTNPNTNKEHDHG